jgi:hypothetical protein
MKSLLSCLAYIFITFSLFAQNPDAHRLPDTTSLDTTISKAFWSVSSAFNSRVLSAGRDYGQSQFGIFPAVSYNHPSGLNAGMSGSVFGDSTLQYPQSSLSVGFGGSLNNVWRYSLSFSHTFFHPQVEGLLANGLGVSTDLSFGAFNVGTSFMAMLGAEENGYRLNLFTSGYWALGQRGFLSQFAFSPSLSGLFGTENIPFFTLPLTQFERATGTRWADRKKNTPVPSPRSRKEGSLQVFGLMSINLALPLYYTLNDWSFSLSPNLVLPIYLSGEEYAEKQNGSAYFNVSISRVF